MIFFVLIEGTASKRVSGYTHYDWCIRPFNQEPSFVLIQIPTKKGCMIQTVYSKATATPVNTEPLPVDTFGDRNPPILRLSGLLVKPDSQSSTSSTVSARHRISKLVPTAPDRWLYSSPNCHH